MFGALHSSDLARLGDKLVRRLGSTRSGGRNRHLESRREQDLIGGIRLFLDPKLHNSMHITPSIKHAFYGNLIFETLIIDDVIALADNSKAQPVMTGSPTLEE
jgi:hypothetical protein